MDKILSLNLQTLTQISSDQGIKPNQKLNRRSFLKLLEYSPWNPPPRQRKMLGDFFYLRIITIEGKELHVTAFAQGFYKNKSTTTNFDPSADSPPYYNLLDLISSESSSFKAKHEQGVFNNLNPQIKHVELPLSKRPRRWLRLDEEIESHGANYFEAGMSIFDMHGYSVNQYRDWNEELFNTKAMAEDDLFAKLNKRKTQNRIIGGFVEAARKGAIAIIEVRLCSLRGWI